jgi:integrase
MEPIRIRVERCLVPHFGRMALEEIDAEAIDGYIKKRKAEGVENATVNRDLGVLRHMLRKAVRKWKWLRQEPYFEMLPENGPREMELTEEQEARLEPVCSPAFWALVQAAIFTGMRQGELIALRESQVDLAGRTLDFTPTKRGRKRLVPSPSPSTTSWPGSGTSGAPPVDRSRRIGYS